MDEVSESACVIEEHGAVQKLVGSVQRNINCTEINNNNHDFNFVGHSVGLYEVLLGTWYASSSFASLFVSLFSLTFVDTWTPILT